MDDADLTLCMELLAYGFTQFYNNLLLVISIHMTVILFPHS